MHCSPMKTSSNPLTQLLEQNPLLSVPELLFHHTQFLKNLLGEMNRRVRIHHNYQHTLQSFFKSVHDSLAASIEEGLTSACECIESKWRLHCLALTYFKRKGAHFCWVLMWWNFFTRIFTFWLRIKEICSSTTSSIDIWNTVAIGFTESPFFDETHTPHWSWPDCWQCTDIVHIRKGDTTCVQY